MGKDKSYAELEYADRAKDYQPARPVKTNRRHYGEGHPTAKKVDHGVKLKHERNPDPEPQKNPGPRTVKEVRSSVRPWKPKGR